MQQKEKKIPPQLSHAKKTLIAFLATLMLMPGVYLAFRPVAPVQAQLPNIELTSITNILQWIGQAIFTGLETAVYKTLKNLAKSLAHKMVETGLEEFATGKKGQEPFWSSKAWEKDMEDLLDNAIGFAVEGMAQGFEKGMKRTGKEQMQNKAGTLDGQSAVERGNAESFGNAAKNCDPKAESCGNVPKLKTYEGDEIDLNKEVEGFDDSKEGLEFMAKGAQVKANDSADKAKNIRSQLDQMDKNEAKRANADRRGQEGGSSDDVAAAVNFLCNPSASISLRISLGTGLGEDPDMVPKCKGSVMAKNWGAVYDRFSTMENANNEAWNVLNDMFETESSDIGVAFNANAAFIDAHEKKTANGALESFITRMTGKDQDDEAGNIKTPGDFIRNKVKTDVVKGEENSTDPVKGMTGKFTADMADVVATFVDSLASKGMDYLKKGLVRNIKGWVDTLKKKDQSTDNLADILRKDADEAAAQAAAEAARLAAEAARARTAEARTTLAIVEEAYPTPPPTEEIPSPPPPPEVVRAQTVLVEAVAAETAAVAAAEEAAVYAATVAEAPLHTQPIDPAVSAVRDAIYNPNAAPSHGGIAAVRRYTASLTRVSGVDGGVMDVLAQLRSTECESSINACVLGDAFANAIQQKMTVREAIESFKRGENAGMNPAGIFGFESQPTTGTFAQAVQPIFQTNFPYNSLVILRKYRVLPVSWELAALYIKEHSNVCGVGESCTLQYMIDAFHDTNSPFFRLVDPNWVLKLPSVYCALKGAGPIQEQAEDTRQTICKNDSNGDGVVCCDRSCLTKKFDGSLIADEGVKTTCLNDLSCGLDEEEETVVRPDICLDEQTCLEDDAQGKCESKMYGYCVEEKKLWRFNGTQCDAVYASCDEFAEKDSQLANYYLKDSIVSPSACTAESAGCQWVSKTRRVGATKTTPVTGGGSLVQEWNSAVGERAYFTPKTQTCTAQAEGCRGIVATDPSGVTSTIHAKIAPAYYQCNDPENTAIDETTGKIFTKPSYRREECKPFALHCSSTYEGCELYTPQEKGGFPIAAKNPLAGCREECAGLTSYSIQKTRLESQLNLTQAVSSAAFIPTSPTVEKCSAANAGCDEFTNVLTGAQAEQRDYFKEIRWCEKKPERPTVFYSPFGSNLGGYSLEKFNVQAGSDGAPACFGGGSGCACTEDEYYGQFTNPNILTINCRQFYVNKDGKGFNPEYYQLDKLVYYTDDCKDYRRTLDGKNGAIYKVSPSLSTSCPASAARCREFRDPTAGNVVMVSYSNFEDGTVNGWGALSSTGTALSVKASNESESLGNHSLEMRGNTVAGTVHFEKNGLLLLGNAAYLIGFSIKVPGSTAVNAHVEILGFEDTSRNQITVTSTPQIISLNTWQYLKFSFPKIEGKPTTQGNSAVRIALTPVVTGGLISSVLFDSITIKQADGVIFAIDDSWVLPDVCLADGGASNVKTNAKLDQIGCKLYTNRSGGQAVFRDVERLCPNEMVGCKAYTKDNAPLYLIEDAKKACLASDNGCTAYGTPKLNIDGSPSRRVLSPDIKTEDWIARYLKVTPEERDISKGVCSENVMGCKTYQIAGQQEQHFKEPKNSVCQWRAAEEKDLTRITDAEAIKKIKVEGIWYYKTCSGKSTVACASNKDCEDIGVGTCGETVCTAGMPKSCPVSQKSCRKITDPECESSILRKSCALIVGRTHDPECEKETFVGRLRRDYGRGTPDVSCQRNYYYLADAENRGECEGKVDVEGGCLLFHDANAGADKYQSADYYRDYFANGRREVSINATDSVRGTDANNLLKVRLDRTCKTWLECEGTINVDGKNICTGRVPCNERASDSSCVNYMFERSSRDTSGEKDRVLKHSTFPLPVGKEAPVPFASLTGLARPDLTFPAFSGKNLTAFDTSSLAVRGHNSLFKWRQDDAPGGSATQLLLALDNTTAPDRVVLNSCRVRPRSDSPEIRYTPRIAVRASPEDETQRKARIKHVDSCNYQNKLGDAYKGIDGYCIEPYPKFTDAYFADVTKEGAKANVLSYGFKGACLNWYPSDRTKTQSTESSVSGEDTLALAAGPAPQGTETLSTKDIYFCAEFGVREHEETMKNAAEAPIAVAIDKVDPIPGIGRTIAVCNNDAPDRKDPDGDGKCTDGTQAYRGYTNKIITKFTVQNDGSNPIPEPTDNPIQGAYTFQGDATSKDGFPSGFPDALKDATNPDGLVGDRAAVYVQTCGSPSGETGNSLVSTPSDPIEGRCSDGTKMYKQLPRIDQMQFKNEDGSAITTNAGVDGLLEGGYARVGDVGGDGKVLIRAPDDNHRDTVMTTKNNYKFDKEVVTYRAFVAGGGTECKTPSDTDISDFVWGECTSGALTDNSGYRYSGYCNVDDYTETATEKIRVVQPANGSFSTLLGSYQVSDGWKDGGYITSDNGAYYNYPSKGDWVSVTQDKDGGTFKGWNISTKGFNQVNVHGTIAKRYRPACSDGKVDLPERSRIDKVTYANGIWDCFGGNGDTWGGQTCKYWSNNRDRNQTGDTPVYSESGQKGIERAFKCTGSYGTCPNGTRPAQWQSRVDLVTTHTPSYNDTTKKVTWSSDRGVQKTNTSSATKPSGRPDQRDGQSVRTTQDYAAAQPRIDKVQYYRGNATTGSVEPAGTPISRIGTTETSVSAGITPTNAGTPKSEIDAGEATSAGVQINIPLRDSRPLKPAYTITAKARYRDVYCKRVVQVAVNGASVPFATKLADWGGASGKQLSDEQVTSLQAGKAPILKSTMTKVWWDQSKRTVSWPLANVTSPYSNYYPDQKTWPASGSEHLGDISRYGYSPYDLAAKDTTITRAQTNTARTWLETSSLGLTRPDREEEAIQTAAKSDAPDTSRIKGLSNFNSNTIDPMHLRNYVGTKIFSPEIYDNLGRVVIGSPPSITSGNETSVMTVTALNGTKSNTADPGDSVTSSSKNFNMATFNSVTPPIGFARYYGAWTAGSDKISMSRDSSIGKKWFFTRPDRYPEIYSAMGALDSFTYEKIANAPNVRLTFYVNTHNDQLPLRTLIVDWNDGDTTKLAESTVDGQGVSELPPCSTDNGQPPCVSGTPLNAKKFEMTHVFLDKKKYFVEAGDAAQICIEVMDNWEKTTKICGTLQNVNPDGKSYTSTAHPNDITH